jgi:hypothetical protein
MTVALLGIFANLIVLFGFFMYFRSKILRTLQTKDIVQQIQSEVDTMITQLNETADRNIALVEERLTRLSTLLADADRRIVVLKRDAARAKKVDEVYTHLKPPDSIVVPEAEHVAEPEVSLKRSPRDEVLALYEQGIEPREIASRVEKTLGEVDLIISLGTKRK